MGYYMRFIVADERPVSAADLEAACRAAGPSYQIAPDATVRFDNAPIAQFEINVPGDGLFEEEREELSEFAEEAVGDGRAAVLATLRSARAIVAVQLLFDAKAPDETAHRLAPLWVWLFEHRHGLLQADGEGYFDKNGQVLQVD